MDFKDLSLSEIHKSIESVLLALKKQRSEIQNQLVDLSSVKELLTEVLKPACKVAKVEKLCGLTSIKQLLTAHLSSVRDANSSRPASDATKKTERTGLTIVQHATAIRPRPSLSSSVQYPAISSRLTQSPKGPRGHSAFVGVPHLCRVTPPSTGAANLSSSLLTAECQERLIAFSDNFETNNSKLQGMFTNVTQKVLVPLQTFCKHSRASDRPSNDEECEKDAHSWDAKSPKDLCRNEFMLVETLNRIRELLWPNDERNISELMSADHYPSDSLEKTDVEAFPVLRIHSDVLQKFDVALNCASLWLKRDEIYTENARSGLLRSHRRFVKTKRMWLQARQIHRELSVDWNQTICTIESHEIRLETLQNDIENLQENILKLQDQRQTVEVKLLNTTEGIERLRSQHRDLRKRINDSCKRLEGRERRCALMQSRLRSYQADREAAREKIQINQEFIKSLQEKMIKIYRDREAWRRRYDQKTNPDALRKKFKAAGLRIPCDVVREKTVVLKTRSENLRDAISIVESRLTASNTHWSVLCHYLNWPHQFLLTLRSTNARVRRRAFSDRDSSSGSSSAVSSPTEDCKSDAIAQQKTSGLRSVTTQRIINYVKSHCAGHDDAQCSFMLELWLDKNGPQATLEKLVRALQNVRSFQSQTSLNEPENT